jgi:hypothetical protein
MAESGHVKVLFIAGTGRSGSTLVDCMLGQLDGFFAAGEMRYLWRRGLMQNRLCGCGVPVKSCPVWRRVLLGDDSVAGRPDPSTMEAEQRRATRARRLPRLLLMGHRSRGESACARDVVDELSRVYQALAAETGARVIVDSSKLPTYGRLLQRCPGLDVTVVHLVRDPRATAFSWQRWRALPDPVDEPWMQRQSPARSAVLWLLWNTVTELFWGRRRSEQRYVRLRYEDLVRDPQGVVNTLLRLVDEPARLLPRTADGSLLLQQTHTAAGNPSRLGTGALRLVTDSEWRQSMSRRHRLLVTCLTLPALRRYGYPVLLHSPVQNAS